MSASRIVSFICPGCDELVELHDVDLNYIRVVIQDLAKQSFAPHRCQLEALKFALVAYLDESPDTIIMTIQEGETHADHGNNQHALPEKAGEEVLREEAGGGSQG